MVVVFPFHAGDKPQAIRLAEWIRDLGGVHGHECMLVKPPSVSDSGVIEPLKSAFSKVEVVTTYSDIKGHPEGPNEMFDIIARMMFERGQPFLWMEPDSVPLQSDWLDRIMAEFKEMKRPFMGPLVKAPPEMPNARDRMNGVGVYFQVPTNAPAALNNVKVPFDLAAGHQIIPKMFPSSLFQHQRSKPFETAEDMKRIWGGVVLYHSNKDGTLIARLREKNLHPLTVEFQAPPMEIQLKQDTIHTFYEPLDSMRDDRLIELWQSNWEYYGWKTKVWNLLMLTKEKPDEVKAILDAPNPEGPHKKDHLLAMKYAKMLAMLPHPCIEPDIFNYGYVQGMSWPDMSIAPYGSDKWKGWPLVHFSLDVVPYPRSGKINTLRPFQTARPKPKGKSPHQTGSHPTKDNAPQYKGDPARRRGKAVATGSR